jgi:hypothetical protein
MRHAADAIDGPRRQGRVLGRREAPVAIWNRVAVGIETGMSERGRQGVHLSWCERVFASLRDTVNGAEGEARLIREVPLEQAVCADDLPCHPFTLRRQAKLLTAGDDEALRLEPAEQTDEGTVPESKGAAQRSE